MEVGLRRICPGERSNISSLFAFEVNHAPQSVRLKDEANLNMLPILVTLDTSHFERSPLNAAAWENMKPISVTLDTSHLESDLFSTALTQVILCQKGTALFSH